MEGFELAKAGAAASQHMSPYTSDPTELRKFTGIDQRVSDRDRFMDMAAKRRQTANLVGKAGGAIDKFNANAGGTIASNLRGAAQKAGLADNDISGQKLRQYEAEGVVSDVEQADAMEQRKKEITMSQIDAAKKAEQMKALTNLGGAVVGGFSGGVDAKGLQKESLWGGLSKKFMGEDTLSDMRNYQGEYEASLKK